MEQDLSARRSRTAQFFAWLRGDQAQTQQQQTQKSDRQVADGYTRGADDPDARRAMRETVQAFHQREGDRAQSAGTDPSERTRASAHEWRYGTMDGYDAIRQDADRRRAAQVSGGEPQGRQQGARGEAQPRPDDAGLRAALEAAQQRFEAQQRSQHRQHGRGR